MAHDAAVHAVGHEEDDVGGHGGLPDAAGDRGLGLHPTGLGWGWGRGEGRRKWTPQVG